MCAAMKASRPHRAHMVICTAVGSTTDRLGRALASAACSSDTGGRPGPWHEACGTREKESEMDHNERTHIEDKEEETEEDTEE